jgi:ribose transport system permease protein
VKKFWEVREFSTLVILALEILFFTWYLWPEAGRSHPFFNAENFLLIFKYSSIYGIAAIGAAIVIICGGIDLAPGAVIALTTVVTGYFFVNHDWPLWASAIAGLLTGLAAGFVSSWLIVRVKLPPFIATLGIMGIWRGAAYIITEARFYDLSAKLPQDWHVAGVSIDWLGPIVMIALALGFQILMTKYQWGRRVFSVGGNEMAALFSGIPVGAVKTSAYVLAGLLASVSGLVLAVVQGQGKADLANGYELDIIASAVVGGASLSGGKGSAVNAALGALLIVLIRQSIRTLHFDQNYEWIIIGCATIVAVVLDQASARLSAWRLAAAAGKA